MNHATNLLSSARLFRWVTLAALCLVVAGCSTHKESITYYRPYDAFGMKVTAGSGPDNEACFEFEKYDVRLMIVAQPSYDPPRIWVSMHLPQGVDARVINDSFTITPVDRSATYESKISYIRGTFMTDGEWISRDFKPGDTLEGANQETVSHFWGNPTHLPRQFVIVAPIGDKLPEEFELLMPEIQINGSPVKMPALYFAKKTGVFRVKNNITLRPW